MYVQKKLYNIVIIPTINYWVSNYQKYFFFFFIDLQSFHYLQ